MLIHTNMQAVQVRHIMHKNSRKKQKCMESLSSGLKLHSAKDGPSDDAIAEKMRVQICSLEQARSNAENGGSMLRVAERGLDAATDLLACMKEIALEAANDTASVYDREILQQECSQLAQAIDEVANHIEFNGIGLLDGTLQKSFHQTGGQ